MGKSRRKKKGKLYKVEELVHARAFKHALKVGHTKCAR